MNVLHQLFLGAVGGAQCAAAAAISLAVTAGPPESYRHTMLRLFRNSRATACRSLLVRIGLAWPYRCIAVKKTNAGVLNH